MATKKNVKVDNAGLGFEIGACGDKIEVWLEDREEQEEDDCPLGYISLNYPCQMNFKQHINTAQLKVIMEKSKQIEEFCAAEKANRDKFINSIIFSQ